MVLISQFRSPLLMGVCVSVLFVVIEFRNISPCYNQQRMCASTREWRWQKEEEENRLILEIPYSFAHNNIQLLFSFSSVCVCIRCMLLSVSIKFNLFVVFDFDVVIVVYDCCATVWVSMKRKNVDAAGTLTHLRKKVVQLCMFSKKKR